MAFILDTRSEEEKKEDDKCINVIPNNGLEDFSGIPYYELNHKKDIDSKHTLRIFPAKTFPIKDNKLVKQIFFLGRDYFVNLEEYDEFIKYINSIKE